MPSTSQSRRKSAFFSLGGERLRGSGPTRSPAAARRAAGGRRGARARRRSCRSTSRRARAARRRASRRARATRRTDAGIRACSSGVSFGSSRSGSSDGSPTGSEPSGSSRAARWPWVRCALTSAIAAATPPSSCASGVACAQRRWAARGGCGAARVPLPLPRCAARQLLEQPRDPGMGRDELGIAALEERAPLGRHRLGVLEVLVEQGARVAGIQAVDVLRAHPCVVPGALGTPAPGRPSSTADVASAPAAWRRRRSRSPTTAKAIPISRCWRLLITVAMSSRITAAGASRNGR